MNPLPFFLFPYPLPLSKPATQATIMTDNLVVSSKLRAKLVFTYTNVTSQIFLQTGQPLSQGSLLPVGERTWKRSCKQVIENIYLKFNYDKYPTPGRHSMTKTPTVGTQDLTSA